MLENSHPQLGRDRRHRGLKQSSEQGFAVGRRQGLEAHDRLPGPPECQRLYVMAGAVRNDQHEASVLQAIDEKLEECDGSSIRPVQVFHDQHQRTVLQPALDDVLRGQEDLALELLGVELARARIFRFEAEQITEQCGEAFDLGLVHAHCLHAGDELLARRTRRILGHHTIGIAQERSRHAVGAFTDGGAQSPADYGRFEMSFRLQPAFEFRQQTGFAGAGFSHEGDNLSLPLQHPLERAAEIAQVALAPHKWSLRLACLQAACRARGCKRSEHSIDRNGLGLAFERDAAEILELERVLREQVGRVAGQDLARLRVALQARCSVHCIASDRVRRT